MRGNIVVAELLHAKDSMGIFIGMLGLPQRAQTVG